MKKALSQGIIDLEDVRKNMQERERKRLLNKHKYKIFQDKDGRWKTTFPDETKKNKRRLVAKSSYQDLENEIVKFYADKEDEIYMHENLNEFTTLRDIYPVWLDIKMYRTKSSSYIKRINNDWEKFYEDDSIVDIPVNQLKYFMLDKWAHEKITKYSLTKKSYYNMSMIMRQCLEYASEEEIGIIDVNPFTKVKIDPKMFLKKKKPSSDTQVFVGDEKNVLCQAALNKFYLRPKYTTPLAIVLNFNLGLRVGELMVIKWADIDGNYLHIQRMETAQYIIDTNGNITRQGVKVSEYTKSEAGDRKIYLNQEAHKILRLIKKTNMSNNYYDDDFIFVGIRSKRITTGSFNKYLYSLCKYAGLDPKSSHKIRKTFVSSLFDKGLNVNKIREIAGHEDERTSLNNYCFDIKTDKESESILEEAGLHLKIADIG